MPADMVAEAGYRGLIAGQRRVIPGAKLKLLRFVIALVPTSVLLAAVSLRQRRRLVRQGQK
jgi:short-subunit dehydrogenase